MATDLMPSEVAARGGVEPLSSNKTHSSLREDIAAALQPLASLKLTVCLFALAVFLVFAGTLAQTRNDIWWVVYQYFRTWVAWIELKVFFPPAWFADHPRLINMPGSFPFPGGLTIGALMAINLLAAHGLRFTIQARRWRLVSGLAVISLGCLLAWIVIASGPDHDGMQAAMPVGWKVLWRGFLICLGLCCVGIAVSLFTLGENRKAQRIVLGSVGAILLTLWAYLLFKIDVNSINPDGMVSAMRVLWQLIKAGVPALILLGGCILLFRKRAGIVLLHAGIGLIMANELVVFMLHRETRMQIVEGETTNFTQDLRSYELAIVDEGASPTHDTVVVVSQDALQRSLASGKPFSHPDLPFDVRLKEFLVNSSIRDAEKDDTWVVDTPTGKVAVVSQPSAAGASSEENVNIPAGRVEFIDKENGAVLSEQTLCALFPVLDQASRPDSRIRAGEKDFQIALQFQKQYRPYSVHLYKVTRKNYPGTVIAQSYSSEFQLVDPSRGTDRRMVTRMNEPIRYGGATIYQSGNPVPGITVFQVVDNFGWMIPYVGCMIVGIGLLAHFSLVLVRFIQRREEGRIEVGNALWGGEDEVAIAPAVASQAPKGKVRRKKESQQTPSHGWTFSRLAGNFLPLAAAAAVLGLLIYDARSPSPKKSSEIDLYAFGQLPIEAGGRILPIDSLARNYLRLISLREAYLESAGFDWKQQDGSLLVTRVHPGSPASAAGLKAGDRIQDIDGQSLKGLSDYEIEERLEGVDAAKVNLTVAGKDKELRKIAISRQYQPAIKWFLDWSAVPGLARKHRVYRIENPDVLNALKLERRKYFRYSWDEISRNQTELNRLREGIKDREPASLSIFEKKIAELGRRIDLQNLLAASFQIPPLPDIPTPEQIRSDEEAASAALVKIRKWHDVEFPAFSKALSQFHPPHAVPAWSDNTASSDAVDETPWNAFSVAYGENYLSRLMGQTFDGEPARRRVVESLQAWESLFENYAGQDAAGFNRAVADYSRMLKQNPPLRLGESDASFEAWFNHWHPFLTCQWTYFAAFCFAALAWLGWKKPLNRTAFVLILIAFVVHTAALGIRMEISGRPMVTNLYSSAIFIGCVVVLAGLVLEAIFRMGFGNILAAIGGYSTLLIADKLSLSIDQSCGDTIGVMQAVLDTQFWLATHVTTITLGYAATFVAGLLGLIYILCGVFTRELSERVGKNLARMIYGTVCFAIFFSFVGTVLGGLWADDSWGRFWGWDPKENGALLIVLWNAIILHARWGGMVKDRGVAILAIGGNIVTAWSWFGVNQLGVGLHSYGFTEGVVLALGFFVLSQLIVIAVGLLPTRYWLSHRATQSV